MDWQTLLDYRLNDLIMVSPEVYEALHSSYIQQYLPIQLCFWLLLVVQVFWLMHYPAVLHMSQAIIWAWLAYQYAFSTLGQVVTLGTPLAGMLAVQTCIHLSLALTVWLSPPANRLEKKRLVKFRIAILLLGIAPWQALFTGQPSLWMSYGMGILPTAIVTIGFAHLLYKGWCRQLAIPLPFLSGLAIVVLLFGVY